MNKELIERLRKLADREWEMALYVSNTKKPETDNYAGRNATAMRKAADTIEAQDKRIAELEQDAKRYRWLRDEKVTVLYSQRPGESFPHVELHGPRWLRRDNLDIATQQAMK